MGKRLVIVESPTKAKTLSRFLGDDFEVESSVGHVRDLPASASEIPTKYKKEPWARLGVNVTNEFAPLYVVHPDKKKKITELKTKLKDADELLLATDEDREGEAISWHLVELLKPKVPTKRMVFHEITKKAILSALDDTREIDSDLVEAQETRRIIDRLYGYEVSPVLWRKIKPKLSAGRVQSVAIRMIVEREQERMRFTQAEYWDLSAQLQAKDGAAFRARLVSVDGKKLAGGKHFDPDTGKLTRGDLVHLQADRAKALAASLKGARFEVISTEEKPFTKSPAAPFTTSTLQQEGNRKLRYDAKRTMRAAQSLYESGFITYMRTDSVNLSTEALDNTRAQIRDLYGDDYLTAEPRSYRNKAKNAQEAHEAIRPAGTPFATVDAVRKKLGEDAGKVYELIWKRTMACQMANARGRRMVVQLSCTVGGETVVFQANGHVVDFPGFLKAYEEGRDDTDDQEAEHQLPPVQQGDALEASAVDADEHHTQPPARLTEASLVKTLEESGVGRPSTYASIISTILNRNYTFKKGNALVPTFTAFAVVNLMREHLTDLVDTNFTARMEDRLDAIARGELERLPYLHEFYFGEKSKGLRPLLDEKVEGIDPQAVCSLPLGKDPEGEDVVVRVGRYGPFLQRGDDRASLPDDVCPDELTMTEALTLLDRERKIQEPLGNHPETGLPVYVKQGRFGPYVQMGESKGDGPKPKMVSLLPDMAPETLTFDEAVDLLQLPRTVGQDAEGNDIVVYLGRYGPYLKRGKDTRSLEPSDHVLKIGLERCLELLAQEKKRGRRQPKELRLFEKVEALDGIEVKILEGRYGPYATDGEYNASLTSGQDPKTITEAEIAQLILDKRAKGPSKKKKKKATKKKATKKKATKKTTKKKTAKKKATKKKATKKTTKKKTAAKSSDD